MKCMICRGYDIKLHRHRIVALMTLAGDGEGPLNTQTKQKQNEALNAKILNGYFLLVGERRRLVMKNIS
jgi:hypothetical protein